jgi:hypothetical protein
VSASNPVAAVTRGRHRTRELGIEERDLGEEVRAEDDGLAPGRRERDDAGAPDLAAGPRRRRDGDDGRERRADEAVAIVASS